MTCYSGVVALDPPLEASPEAVRAALDRVCRQADCVFSGLHWYTDLGIPASKLRLRAHDPDELPR